MSEVVPTLEGDELPSVEHSVPVALRLFLIACGLFALVTPAVELGPALWPPNVIGAFFAIIIVGGASVGAGFIAAGVFGESQHWSYEPGALLVERRGWRSVSRSRLTARDILSIDARRVEHSEGADTWRAVIVPREPISVPRAARFFQRGALAYETRDFSTERRAEEAKRALRAHLGMPLH